MDLRKISGITAAFFLCGLLASCGGTSSQTGTPAGTTSVGRQLKGQFSEDGGNPKLRLQALKTQTDGGDQLNDSCPSDQGTIQVRAVPAHGDVIDGAVASDGKFSLNLNQDSTYYLLFFQNDQKCAELVNGPNSSKKGKNVIIGKGVDNVDLGVIKDAGNGVLIASKTPSFDSDGDGVMDERDSDANGDGESDCDADHDGIKDYADDSEGGHTLGSCDIVDIYPNEGGPLYLNEKGEAVLDLSFNNTFLSKGILADQFQVVDESGDTVVPFFTLEPFEGEGDGLTVIMGNASIFTPFSTYRLTIAVGAITCADETSNPTEVSISFTVFSEDYLNEVLSDGLESDGSSEPSPASNGESDDESDEIGF